MQAETRIMLAVLLLGVAHQEPKNIKWLDNYKEGRLFIASDASRFVHSDEFDMMCRSINIKPERLRELSPAQAMKLFELITSDSKKDTKWP